MMNLHKVIDILADLVSNHLSLNSIISNTQEDDEMVNMLFENIKSILTPVFYSSEKMISC